MDSTTLQEQGEGFSWVTVEVALQWGKLPDTWRRDTSGFNLHDSETSHERFNATKSVNSLLVFVLLPDGLLGVLRGIEVKFVQVFDARHQFFQAVTRELHQGLRLKRKRGWESLARVRARDNLNCWHQLRQANKTMSSFYPWASSHRVVGKCKGCSCQQGRKILQEGIAVNQTELSKVLLKAEKKQNTQFRTDCQYKFFMVWKGNKAISVKTISKANFPQMLLHC